MKQLDHVYRTLESLDGEKREPARPAEAEKRAVWVPTIPPPPRRASRESAAVLQQVRGVLDSLIAEE